MKFQSLVEIGGYIMHAKAPWMINILEPSADEHIELYFFISLLDYLSL